MYLVRSFIKIICPLCLSLLVHTTSISRQHHREHAISRCQYLTRHVCRGISSYLPSHDERGFTLHYDDINTWIDAPCNSFEESNDSFYTRINSIIERNNWIIARFIWIVTRINTSNVRNNWIVAFFNSINDIIYSIDARI